MTVLVTGATGNVGAQLVRALSGRDVPVRAFVRDAARAAGVLGEEADLRVGDFEDPASVARALEGVDRVFLSSADGPRKAEHEAAVIDACRRSRVRLVVKASTIGADAASALPAFAWNGRAEDHLRSSGLAFAVLRSAFYMTNVLGAVQDGRLLAPAGDGRVAMIDPADVAEVAAAVLAGGDHAGRTYRLTGPEAIGFADAAAAMGLAYVDLPPDAARAGLAAAGMPQWLVAQLDGAFSLVRQGAMAEVTDTVQALAGRAPRSFAAFARERLGEAAVAPS